LFHAPVLGYPEAIVLGLLQGLTEFLPVSSTAHMAIAPQLLFGNDPGAAFSAIVQLGPVVAIIIYFRNDLVRYVQGIFRHPNPMKLPKDDIDAKLGWYVVIATLPIILFGVLLQHKIDKDFRSLYVIAGSLIALAGVLFWAEKTGPKNTSLENITFRESFIIGLAQVLALVPGASRSGVTITAGLFQGLDRESAARFSFLLSIPSITAAGLFKIYQVVHKEHLTHNLGLPFLAAIIAGLFAYVVIRWFLGFMKEHSTTAFIIYRIVLGILILGLLSFHIIESKAPLDTASTGRAAIVRIASR
jgi:undecaprenyl-diphosphatase